MLPLDSGPKLAVGQWTAWWSGLPGGSSSKTKLCILKGILKLSNEGQATKGWDYFYGRSWPLNTPCEDFNLAIVGLGWMKWLKNGAEKCLYFMQLSFHYILFCENFIG